MRLKLSEVENIILAIEQSLTPAPGTKLYLYGSRTNDNLKGGDIDLLLCTSESYKEKYSEKKYLLLARIKDKIGEQKIDLSICTQDDLKKDRFYSLIIEDALLLHQWK